MRGRAIGDRLRVVARDFVEGDIGGVLEARARKVPAQVRVHSLERISTMLTDAARRGIRLAQQALPEPERETLLADSGSALQQQACGQRAARGLVAEAIAERIVTDEWQKGHGE